MRDDELVGKGAAARGGPPDRRTSPARFALLVLAAAAMFAAVAGAMGFAIWLILGR